MRLIRLSANQPTFKTVNFNRTGVTYIRAKQEKPHDHDLKRTYNGVGKSLIVALVNFCLGSNPINTFKDKLPDWEFTLDIEIKNTAYSIRRSTQDQKVFYLNENKCTKDKLRSFLAENCFQMPADSITYLTFRTLLSFFLRPKKSSYNDCRIPEQEGSTPYKICLNNSFLLGLNLDFVRNKYELKIEKKKTEDLKANISNDPLLKDFLSGRHSSELALKETQTKIAKLDEDIKKYQVSADYDEVAIDANNLKCRLDENRNEITILESQLRNIEKSLNIDPDLEKNEIVKLYNESKKILSDSVIKTLTEVEDFYKKLIAQRTQRLWNQKTQIQKNLGTLIEQRKDIEKKLDEHIIFLGKHQALDVYRTVVIQREELVKEKEKISRYEDLVKQYDQRRLDYKRKILDTIEQVDKYLINIEKHIADISDYFTSLAKRFYPDAIAGITVKCNNGDDNQISYDIEPRIESDGSDGINNIRTFCYDLTLLFFGKRHSINFVFHDSRLFTNVSATQHAEWFRVIHGYFKDSDRQYIATINQNQIDTLKYEFGENEANALIEPYVTTELTDEGDEGKLLGITVDLDYEK